MNAYGQQQQKTVIGLPVYLAATVGACTTAYCLAFLSPRFALDFRHGFLWPLVGLGLAAWLQKRFRAYSDLVVFCFILSSCGLALFGLWQSGLSDGHVLGGVLPLSDGGGYFQDTLNYLTTGYFSSKSSLHPLFTTYMTSLYVLLGQNYRLTLVAIMLVAGLSIFFASRSIDRTCGQTAGLCMAFLLFLFYRTFVGTALTENLGFVLGAAGFACIWDANATTTKRLYYWGLFLLALGLNSRAGAFFILPALAFWSGMAFRGSTRYTASTVAISFGAIAAAFAINFLILLRLGIPELGFSNFSLTLYGLLTGGDWTTFFTQNPQLLAVPEAEASKIVYNTCINIIINDPASLVRGIIRAWREMYLGRFGSYMFVWVHSVDMTPVLFRKVSITFIAGLLNVGLLTCLTLLCIRKFRARTTALPLILASFLGVFLSVPFAPPWDAGPRVYAATIPFQVMLPVVGLCLLSNRMRGAAHSAANPNCSGHAWLLGLIITMLCLAPVLGIARGNPPTSAQSAVSNETEDRVKLDLKYALNVHIRQERWLFDPTTVALGTYQDTQRLAGDMFESTLGPGLRADLAAIHAGTTLWMALDQSKHRRLYLTSDQEYAPPQGPFYPSLRTKVASGFPFRLTHMDHSTPGQ